MSTVHKTKPAGRTDRRDREHWASQFQETCRYWSNLAQAYQAALDGPDHNWAIRNLINAQRKAAGAYAFAWKQLDICINGRPQ